MDIKKTFLIGSLIIGLVAPLTGWAAEQDLQQKIEALSKEVEVLKQQVKKTEDKSLGKWLTIGGDYRFRYDYLRGEVPAYTQGYIAPPNPAIPGGYSVTYPQMQGIMVPAHNVENKSLYSNRFGLDMKAKATKDVTVTARFLMYKIAGAQDDGSLRDGNTSFSFDRAGLFDGTIGHVPGSSTLAVDRVYATCGATSAGNRSGSPLAVGLLRAVFPPISNKITNGPATRVFPLCSSITPLTALRLAMRRTLTGFRERTQNSATAGDSRIA